MRETSGGARAGGDHLRLYPDYDAMELASIAGAVYGAWQHNAVGVVVAVLCFAYARWRPFERARKRRALAPVEDPR